MASNTAGQISTPAPDDQAIRIPPIVASAKSRQPRHGDVMPHAIMAMPSTVFAPLRAASPKVKTLVWAMLNTSANTTGSSTRRASGPDRWVSVSQISTDAAANPARARTDSATTLKWVNCASAIRSAKTTPNGWLPETTVSRK